MTTQENQASDSELLQRVADRYRQRGYDVLVEPSGEQRPDFLGRFRPDMIARRGDESVVVELKRKRPGQPDPELRKLASEIARHPEWRLDLVLSDEIDRQGSMDLLRTLSAKELAGQLEEGLHLCRSGHVVGGILLIWASFEGIARLAAGREGLDVSPTEAPLALVRGLVSEGIMEDPDYEVVKVALERRNGIAHGFAASPEDRETFERLGEIARRLLTASEISG